jgi:hypothetical protein
MKTIKITCNGATTVSLDEVTPLQGDLKSLSREDYSKLKRSILKYGFSFPFFLWQNGKKKFSLDGHQREKVLKKMRDEGYEIPKLPAVLIEAANEKEAKEKILLVSSQYGHMTEQSLVKFLSDVAIDLEELDLMKLPEVKLEKLGDFADERSAGSSAADLKDQFLILVTCESEQQQQDLLRRFEKEKVECRALIS